MIIQWLLVSTAHICPLQLNVPSLYRIQTAPYTKYKDKHAILTQNTNTPSLHRIQRQTAPYTEYKDKCAILTQNTKTNSPLHRIQRQMCHPYTEYKDKQPLTQNTNMPSLHRIQGQTALYTEYKDSQDHKQFFNGINGAPAPSTSFCQ